MTEKLGSELKVICTINEANMGLQLAAISKRFQLMAQQAAQKAKEEVGKEAEGTVQVGMNFQNMDKQRGKMEEPPSSLERGRNLDERPP